MVPEKETNINCVSTIGLPTLNTVIYTFTGTDKSLKIQSIEFDLQFQKISKLNSLQEEENNLLISKMRLLP